MKLLLEHTVYMTGSVKAVRYSIQKVGASKKRNPISPDMLRIVYIRQGGCNWVISGRSYVVEAGDIVLLNNTEKRFQTEIAEDKPVEQEVIRFMPVAFPECNSCLPVFLNRTPEFSNVLTGNYPGRETLISLIDMLRAEASADMPGKDTAILAITRLLLIGISRTCASLGYIGDNRADIYNSVGNYQLICNSVNYIKENLNGKISVDLLSRYAGISRSYYSRMFHALMGVTVPQYVRLRRLIRVNEGIKSGLNITEAVFAAGFGSLSAYYKALNDTDE